MSSPAETTTAQQSIPTLSLAQLEPVTRAYPPHIRSPYPFVRANGEHLLQLGADTAFMSLNRFLPDSSENPAGSSTPVFEKAVRFLTGRFTPIGKLLPPLEDARLKLAYEHITKVENDLSHVDAAPEALVSLRGIHQALVRGTELRLSGYAKEIEQTIESAGTDIWLVAQSGRGENTSYHCGRLIGATSNRSLSEPGLVPVIATMDGAEGLLPDDARRVVKPLHLSIVRTA